MAGLYFSQWYGLWAPKGTPNNVIGKLNNAVVDALGDPLVRSGLADLAQGIFPSDQQTPAALRAYHKAEIVIALFLSASVVLFPREPATRNKVEAPTR